MGQIEVFSPAKINLFLAVVGRMESGFHELASLVAQLDFGDRLSVEARPGPRSVSLRCDEPSLPTDGRNLAAAAASRFLDRYALDLAVEIDLQKRIPHGAGLGGGSSNAVAALRALSQLTGCGESDELAAIAAELGSDCPLFLRQEPVIMRGRGELLDRIEQTPGANALRGRRVLLLKPSFGVSTVWAYRALAARPDWYEDRDWAESQLDAWKRGDLPIERLLRNTLERPAFAKYPALALMKDRFAELGMPLLMSGSGSCCFALADTDRAAENARDAARNFWGEYVFVTQANIL